MQIPHRFRAAAWLCFAVLAVAGVTHGLNLSHDITLMTGVIAVVLAAVDWMLGGNRDR